MKENQNSFVTASFIMGIIAIVSVFICGWIFYLPIIFGSLAITFGLLSKGSSEHMHSNATAGVITGSIAMGINILIFMVLIVYVLLFSDFLDAGPFERHRDGYRNDYYEDSYDDNDYYDSYEDGYYDGYDDGYNDSYNNEKYADDYYNDDYYNDLYDYFNKYYGGGFSNGHHYESH